MSRSEKGREAYKLGHLAEWRAILHGWLCGYRLLERRHRNPFGEIDLIWKRRSQIVFVEVKARPSRDEGLYAIQPRQQQRMGRAASAWLARHPHYQNHELRFDLVVVVRLWHLHRVKNIAIPV